MIRVRTAVLGLPLALALESCIVGPRLQPSSLPAGGEYMYEASTGETVSIDMPGGEAQRFLIGGDLQGQWWTLFGSTRLNRLIEEAMMSYPDIAAQQAALRASRETVRSEQGSLFPQLTGTANGVREKVSGAANGPGFPAFITNVFQANVNVSYALDIFGGERRAIQSLQAQAMAQNFELEASYVTLISNVASTVIELASVQDQIEATREIIALEAKQLSTIERQFKLGSRTKADVLLQVLNLAAVRATLPPLQQEESSAGHQLAVLTGHFPCDAASPAFTLTELQLPQDLPISLPSRLVEQRPDIKQQEMQMRQANAGVGVATANMLPQLTLTGSYGGEALDFSRLFSPASNAWNLATGLAQPLFQGGTLRAKRRAAIDVYEQASSRYRLIVLQAFGNVADTLSALDHDALALHAQFDALNAAQSSLELIQRQYDDGAVSYVSLLVAQQAYQQARLANIRAVQRRYTDTVTLFQALGGGWWNRRDRGTLQADLARTS